jgi:hypothetical protein
MGKSLWTTRLRDDFAELRSADELVNLRAVDVFLFGSASFQETPSDLDILLVYDPRLLTPSGAIELRVELVDLLTAKYGLPVDIVLLSVQEDAQSLFSEREAAVLLLART